MMRGFLSLAVSLSLGVAQPSRAADLSPEEKKLSQYLQDRKEEPFALLERLVNINSGSENIEGVQQVGELLRSEFAALGFTVRWEKAATPMPRAGMLIAERVGHRGKRLLLIGHLDTVFPANSPFQTYSRTGNRIAGPGVTDMKSGDVVILYALKALVAQRALDDTTIRVVLTGDEENAAKPATVSRQPLIKIANDSDIAIDFEPTPRGMASAGRRGVSLWEIESTGTEGHSSLVFSDALGYGASYELARILNEIRVWVQGEKGVTINPGLVAGGTDVSADKDANRSTVFGKENVIARRALARGDLRCLSPEQLAGAQEQLAAIVARHLPGTSSSIKYIHAMPAMTATAANMQLFAQYRAISQKLGYGDVALQPAELRGGGDISYIADLVNANLVGIGGNGNNEHSVNETLEADTILIQSKRAALLIYALTR